MGISTVDTEINSYEPIDKEPYHYVAAYRYKGGPLWSFMCTYPTTDKQALVNMFTLGSIDADEVRIMKVRLPIGQ